MNVFGLRATPQIEADRRLLRFNSYEDYLDSLNTNSDECYLGSTEISRTIAELGYRSSGETLNKKEFMKRLAAVMVYLYPPYKPYESSSMGMKGGDDLQTNLALRERSNRVGILSTIVFVRTFNEDNFEVSGYIDYAERLVSEDWKPFFKGKKKLIPKHTDLGYYHWRSGNVLSNDSLNWKVVQDLVEGLVFQNRFDRMVIHPAPHSKVGQNTTRKRIHADKYELLIIFDHVVRQRI